MNRQQLLDHLSACGVHSARLHLNPRPEGVVVTFHDQGQPVREVLKDPHDVLNLAFKYQLGLSQAQLLATLAPWPGHARAETGQVYATPDGQLIARRDDHSSVVSSGQGSWLQDATHPERRPYTPLPDARHGVPALATPGGLFVTLHVRGSERGLMYGDAYLTLGHHLQQVQFKDEPDFRVKVFQASLHADLHHPAHLLRFFLSLSARVSN